MITILNIDKVSEIIWKNKNNKVQHYRVAAACTHYLSFLRLRPENNIV